MEKIITQRKAQDDYHAVLVAQAMENAGLMSLRSQMTAMDIYRSTVSILNL